MNIYLKKIVSFGASILLLMACNASSSIGDQEVGMAKDASTLKAEQQWQVVTIKYMDFEGGFFGMVTEQGEKLLPVNLASKYHQAEAIVKIQGQLIKDMMTIQQWGTPFKISKIELIKAGKPVAANKTLY